MTTYVCSIAIHNFCRCIAVDDVCMDFTFSVHLIGNGKCTIAYEVFLSTITIQKHLPILYLTTYVLFNEIYPIELLKLKVF